MAENYEVRSLEDILKELDSKMNMDEASQPPRREAPAEDVYDEEIPARPIRRKKKKEEEEELSWQESLMMTLHDVLGLIAVVVVVFVLLFRIVVVSGSSMYNTLWHNDYLLVKSNALDVELAAFKVNHVRIVDSLTSDSHKQK